MQSPVPMKITILPSLSVLIAVGSLFPASATLARANATFLVRSSLRAPSPADSIEAATVKTAEGLMPTSPVIEDEMQAGNACSCDCCQVQKLLPMDFVQRGSGPPITSACMKPSSDQASGSNCPRVCHVSSSFPHLSIAEGGEVDYTRFCLYSCQPVSETVGSVCREFDVKHYKQVAAGGDHGMHPPQIPPALGAGTGSQTFTGGGSGTGGGTGDGTSGRAGGAGDGSGGTGDKNGGAAAQAGSGGAAVEKIQIVYDMRKLVAERLRSEAGASMAAGAAAAERVRVNQWMAKKNAVLLKKARTKLGAVVGKVEGAVADVAASSAAADEAETKTKKQLVEGRIFATDMVDEVRKLTDAAIKLAVTPCAEVAAKNRAEAKGLDKPKDWVKVVAARAANPYQKAVTDAVIRTAEYKRYADGLMDQAYGAQKKANSLIPHVNVLEAQGDVLGATIERKQVSDLMASAKSLQSSAQANWDIAKSTRETIPKWQDAAAQSAAYAAWEYANNAQAFR